MHKSDLKVYPEYKKPPVIEVVCGLAFEKIKQFRGNHIGLFWQNIRDEFPDCEHAQRMEFNPQEDFAKSLPRMWFVNQQKNRLIQLEDGRFYYNWRSIEKDEDYPRYSTIIEAFKSNLDTFKVFLDAEKLGLISPKSCELSYINHIPMGEGWESLVNLNEVLRDFSWYTGDRFLPQPDTLGAHVFFQLPDGKGRLTVTLQHAKRSIDKHPILILQLTAKGLGADKSMDLVWEWFDVAHEWIVCGFTDLTGPSIQKDTWQRIDNL